jgi:hypothetical protein
MPAITRAPRSRPASAPAWPGDRVTPAAARQQPAQDPTQELRVTRGLSAEVTEYLRRHQVITLSTASVTGMPHADTVVYASDSASIFFFAGEGTQLLQNIQASRWVSFTIDDYTAGWAKGRELQGAGRCLPATAAQHAAAWPLYVAKFGPGFARPPGPLHAIVRSAMHFVDHDHAVVTGQPARLRRMFPIGDSGAPGTGPGRGRPRLADRRAGPDRLLPGSLHRQL